MIVLDVYIDYAVHYHSIVIRNLEKAIPKQNVTEDTLPVKNKMADDFKRSIINSASIRPNGEKDYAGED